MVTFTPANIDGRSHVAKLAQRLFGKRYGDKGYISQKLHQTLQTEGVFLTTKVRKNMKTKLSSDLNAPMLRKCLLIE